MSSLQFYRRPWFLILVVVSVIGFSSFVVLRNRTPTLPPEEARSKAAAFLESIRTGHVDDAWTSTATDFKSMYGKDRFRQFVKSKPLLKEQAEFQLCEFQNHGGLSFAECRFQVSNKPGSITVVLCLDQGAWKVGRLSVD